jgi:hypothetical protein
VTIPDLISEIKYYVVRFIDKILAIMEHTGSRMSVYAWNKRWRNREQGTGYAKKPSSEVFTPSPREDDTE